MSKHSAVVCTALGLLLAVCVAPAGGGQVTTVLFDDFSGAGGNLPGTSPDTGSPWTGSTTFKDNGTATSASRTVYSSVPITPGAIYTLQGYLNPSGTTSGDWLALGFTQTADDGQQQINTDGGTGYGWMLLRANGLTQAFNGPNTSNIAINNLAVGNPSTVQVVLDTRNPANYTVEYFNENASIGGPHSIGTPSLTQVAVSSYNISGTFDNVLLNRETATWTQELLLSDDFTVTGTSSTSDLNFNLANRQTGDLALQTWGRYGNAQSGNLGTGDKTVLDNGNVLLLASGAKAEINRNFNGADSAGGLEIVYDAAPDVQLNQVNSNRWVAINLGADPNTVPSVNTNATHFGLLVRENGGFQAFDGNTAVGAGSFTGTPLEDQFYRDIRLLLTDPTDGNPFDGVGQTDIQAFYGGSQFFSFTKSGGGYANNYINFNANGIGYVDNVSISRVPEPATLALLSLAAYGLGGYVRRRRKT